MSQADQCYEFGIVGAGISGLSLAYYLKQLGHDVLVLEKSSQAGGLMQTYRHQHYQIELAPNTLLLDPVVAELLSQLALQDQIIYPLVYQSVYSKGAPKRFIEKDGQLLPLPTKPLDFLRSPILSFRARIRVVLELLCSRNNKPERSLAAFFQDHFGQELTDMIIDPFISGTWSGDIHQLSVDACFPQLKQIEQQTGSIIRHWLKNPPTPPKIFSIKNGLQTLTDRLADEISPNLHLNCELQGISKTSQSNPSHQPSSILTLQTNAG